jgi:hypothetical protein
MEILCMAVMIVLSGACWEQDYNGLPVLATAYNWESGGINCDHDCGTMATGRKTGPELVGVVAACPAKWVRLDRTAVITLGGVDYFCWDTFGSEANRKPVYHRGEWMIRIDVTKKDPASFGIRVFNNWSMRWVTEGG